jgi:L-lactate dehydrogenase (cytochrome)
MNLRLLGARTLKDIVPEMVDASNLQSHIVVPRDDLYSNNCASHFRYPDVFY